MGKLRKNCAGTIGQLLTGVPKRVGSQYPEAYISLPVRAPISLKSVDTVSSAVQQLLEDRTFWKEY